MESNLSVLVKKYSVPVLFFILGIFLLVTGIKSKQDTMFMMSAVLMFLAGLLSILYSTGKLKMSLLYIIGAIAGIGAIATMYFSWDSVKQTSTYNENYKLCRGKSIQNLIDIRSSQKAYLDKYGKYAPDWETLIDFINNGTVPEVIAKGDIPARKLTPEESKFIYKDNRPQDVNMNEKEAYILSKSPIVPPDLKGFVRDTIQVPLLKTRFQTKAYIESRKKAGYGKFYADSLPYIPFTNGKKMWKMQVADSVQIGEDYFPAIEVSGEIPFAKIQGTENEKLSFGKITSNETAGSWEND